MKLTTADFDVESLQSSVTGCISATSSAPASR